MPSSCTNLATHAVRLREAQRAFFLAWKAVQSGNRGTLAEGRAVQRELARVHADIQRTLYVAWTPKALERVEKKGELVFAGWLEARSDDIAVRDMSFLPDGELLAVYAGTKGSSVVRRPIDRASYVEGADVQFRVRGTITRCLALPDHTWLFIENGALYKKRRDRIFHIICIRNILSHALHAHYDGRIFACDMNGNIHIWTPIKGKPYGHESWRAHDRGVRGLHIFADATFVTTSDDGSVKYWRAVEGEENAWDCEVLEESILPSALHASVNGRLAVGTPWGRIFVWERAENGLMKKVNGYSADARINDLQVLPDRRIVFVTDALTESGSPSVTILALNDHDEYVVEQSFNMGESDVSYESVCVREDGLIVVTDDATAGIVVLDDHVKNRKKKR